jgi:hypothetical protein
LVSLLRAIGKKVLKYKLSSIQNITRWEVFGNDKNHQRSLKRCSLFVSNLVFSVFFLVAIGDCFLSKVNLIQFVGNFQTIFMELVFFRIEFIFRVFVRDFFVVIFKLDAIELELLCEKVNPVFELPEVKKRSLTRTQLHA